MTRQELIQKLHKLYTEAQDRQVAVTIHLYGIEYANELLECGSLKEIAKEAQIPISYATEIRKGINLSKFVKIK